MGIFIDGVGSQFDAGSLQNRNITMRNLEVSSCGGHGIHIKGTDTITATGLHMYDNGWADNDLHHNIYYLRVRNATITDSTFNDSPSGHGMRMGSVEIGTFDNVIVEDNADHGIHFSSSSNVGGIATVEGNCAIPRGTCQPIACYGDCDNIGVRRR